MDNNDILKRLRYTFDYEDSKMISIFELADYPVKRSELSRWLKKTDDSSYMDLPDKILATFLNGFIAEKRGKREGKQPVSEEKLNNNIILRKLKIALNLKAEDVQNLFELIGKSISPHELSSFLRNADHEKYRFCNDQYLRNFVSGIQQKYKVHPKK